MEITNCGRCGPLGTLIETRDEPGGGSDASKIARLIDEALLGSD